MSNNPRRSNGRNKDGDEVGDSSQYAGREAVRAAAAAASTTTTNEAYNRFSNTSGNTQNPNISNQELLQRQQQIQNQLQQIQGNSPLNLLNSLGISMQAAILAGSQTQQGTDFKRLQEALNSSQSQQIPTRFPGQTNTQFSPALLVGIQQLIRHLSDNLNQEGLRTNAMPADNPLLPVALSAQTPHSHQLAAQQQQQQNLQQHQSILQSLSSQAPTSSDSIQAATASLFPGTNKALRNDNVKPPPPIHPGATAISQVKDGHPDYATIPCRARGMPPDHNSQTAYFVVPNNIVHGENLICSYRHCAALGVKFCYCVHCGIPVAKRNFRQRHDHGQKKGRQLLQQAAAAVANLKKGEVSASAPSSSTEGVAPQDIEAAAAPAASAQPQVSGQAAKQARPKANHPRKEGPAEQESISSRSSSMTSIEDGRAYAQDPSRRRAHGRNLSNVIRTGERSSRKVWKPGNVSEERERGWASLLYDRPEERNEDDMSQWLLSVLQVSDPATSLPSMSSSNGANDESPEAANTTSATTNNGSTSTSNGDSGSGRSNESHVSRVASYYPSPSDNARRSKGKRKSVETGKEEEPIRKKQREQESPDQAV